MQCLQSALDTPTKLDLLKEVRSFVPTTQVAAYDRLAPYKQMAHPIQPLTRGTSTLKLNTLKRKKKSSATNTSSQPRPISISGMW